MKKKSEYGELLASPKWKERREDILERDDHCCQICGASDNNTCDLTLEIHHQWYETGKMPWEYPDDCLITLCSGCHRDETIKYNEIIYMISKMDWYKRERLWSYLNTYHTEEHKGSSKLFDEIYKNDVNDIYKVKPGFRKIKYLNRKESAQ